MSSIEFGNKVKKGVLTAAFAPLSRARVKTSSSIDAVDELKSQGIIAIHGVVAEKRSEFLWRKLWKSDSLGGVELLALASEKWTNTPLKSRA